MCMYIYLYIYNILGNWTWELDYSCCRGPDPVGDKSGRGFSREPFWGSIRINILLQGLLKAGSFSL